MEKKLNGTVIEKMWGGRFNYEKISESALEQYSSETYIKRLLEFYKG